MKLMISLLFFGFILSFTTQSMAQEVNTKKTAIKKECAKACCAKTEHSEAMDAGQKTSMKGEHKEGKQCSEEKKANCAKADKKASSETKKASCTESEKANCKKKCSKDKDVKKEEMTSETDSNN